MGFGWMFLGYLFLLGSNLGFFGLPMDVTPDLLGFLLMTHGFSVASQYCTCFKTVRVLGFVGIPCSALILLRDALAVTELVAVPTAVNEAVSYLYSFFLLAFTLALLWALYLIASQTEIERLKNRAVRCAVYTVILFAAEHSLATILSWFGAVPNSVAAIELLAGAIYVLLNAALIFSCYMWICLEGDEDMPDNRKHKYKTPFDYFDRAKERDAARANVHSKKKKKK